MSRPRTAVIVASFITALWLVGPAAVRAEHAAASSIAAADIVEPDVLAAQMGDPSRPHALLLQVGAHVLYVQAHIAGSEYVGAGSTDEGIAALRKRVAKLPKDSPIVLYCGCCPWSRCPNIAPAYAQLQRLGFRNVKALHIVNDFGTDWVDHGYPVAHGE